MTTTIWVLLLYANGAFWTVSAALPTEAACEREAVEALATVRLLRPELSITHICQHTLFLELPAR